LLRQPKLLVSFTITVAMPAMSVVIFRLGNAAKVIAEITRLIADSVLTLAVPRQIRNASLEKTVRMVIVKPPHQLLLAVNTANSVVPQNRNAFFPVKYVLVDFATRPLPLTPAETAVIVVVKIRPIVTQQEKCARMAIV